MKRAFGGLLAAVVWISVFTGCGGEAETPAHPDPHVWMDVMAWSRCTGYVAEFMAKYDAKHADAYRAGAKAYQEKLAKLDQYAAEVINSIPKEQRVLVTAHDAFGYFADRYQIEVHAPQGVDTQVKANPSDINRLVDFVVKRKIKALFPETSVNDQNLVAVKDGAKSRGFDVEIVKEKLFSDSMGTPGTYHGTYIGMIDHNATTIARALGGKAPEGGFQEWLQKQADGTQKNDAPTTEKDAAPAKKHNIMATTGMVADIVKAVAGELAEVHMLIPAKDDPHEFNARRSDTVRLQEADVVIYSGLYLEARLTEIFENQAREGKPVFAVTEKLQEDGYPLRTEF